MGARERILQAAYDLFSHYGIRAAGIDTIIAVSGVAKMSLYTHFQYRHPGRADRPRKFAQMWPFLIKGGIIAAGEGNRQAAQQAKEAGAILLANWPRRSL